MTLIPNIDPTGETASQRAARIAWAIASRRCVVCGEAVKGRRRCCDGCGKHWHYCPKCKQPQPLSLFYRTGDGRCIPCALGREVESDYRGQSLVEKEQVYRQIDRLLAIEMPWKAIAERLGEDMKRLQHRYYQWHKRRAQKAST